jgi:hypothetical protein
MFDSSADDVSITDESEKLSSKGKAAAMLSKTLKECVVIGRRARFSWRRMRAGVLVFKESREMGGGQRVFAIGKKLGEGGYSTIWLVHEWQPDGSERQYAVKRVLVNRSDPEQAAATTTARAAARAAVWRPGESRCAVAGDGGHAHLVHQARGNIGRHADVALATA